MATAIPSHWPAGKGSASTSPCLRVFQSTVTRETDVCDKCTDKGCLAGNDKGWGCPWLVYPSKLDRNNYCGLCMECVKTCPHDNMTVNLRPFCSDTKLKGYDEAWKAFIMLALAIAYSVIYQGPWGVFKCRTLVGLASVVVSAA